MSWHIAHNTPWWEIHDEQGRTVLRYRSETEAHTILKVLNAGPVRMKQNARHVAFGRNYPRKRA